MPADEEETKPLAERVVKEAVTVGLETPMREPILEAVEEAGEGEKDPSRTVPMAGALLGLGAAAGYLLGARDADFDAEDVPIDDFEEPDVIDDVVSGEDKEEDADEELEEEAEEPSGGRLRPILLGLSLVAAVALIRRKLQSSEDEWEPIEEFETEDDDEFGGDFGSDEDEADEEEEEEADEEEEEEADADEEEEAEVEEEEAE